MMGLPLISLADISPADMAGLAAAAASTYVVAKAVYNLYFHRLARFPGPVLHRATDLAYLYKFTQGTLPRNMIALHKKYGPVVRIRPNELAFIHPDAWRDIYGHGTEELPKYATFYRTRGIPANIIAEDRETHTLLRRHLEPQFNDRSLRKQEPLIGQYADLLVRRLRERAIDPDRRDRMTGLQASRPLDMAAWYSWTTFDIIGDLAFGEPFGCLEKAQVDPWVKAIYDTVKASSYLAAIKYLGWDILLVPILKIMMNARKEHNRRTREKLERRVALKGERHDLIEGLLKARDELNMDAGRLMTNAGAMIVAGSDTTSTVLSGATYLLLENPDVLKKLTEEVRSAFKSDEKITLTSVGNLSYMLACLNEAMRRYTPIPFGMPRIVPKGSGGATIAGEFVPEGTVVAVWQLAAYYSEDNFAEPFGYHPERFLHDPKFAGDRLEALQPFSVGPRNCIGRNLAYAEMCLILAKIIFNFDMHLVEQSQDWLDQEVYVLWSKPELKVYLNPVD